ncbi:MAG: HlyD family efflux transporter periplasmic adaptor subunit [Dethiosulfatibacter sp.]|nr:HlyD family efflux transporter periplasmic adaptor subunit [Dethiosulfatibacter sp.]
MKKIVILILLVLVMTACTTPIVQEIEKSASVQTTLAVENTYSRILKHVGVVQTDQIKKYSFKTSGYLQSLNVAVSDKVAPGDTLASVDTTDIGFQMAAAKNQMDAAYAQYQKALKGASLEEINAASLNVEKAKSVFDYQEKNYNDMISLHKEGVISSSTLEEAALALSISEKDYQQSLEMLSQAEQGAGSEDEQMALSQYMAAKNGYEAYRSLVEDTVIFSDVFGTVISVLYEESELVPQGYPVVVVASNKLSIETGVTLKDMAEIKLNTPTIVKVNDVSYDGRINAISPVPDQNQLTYNISVEIDGVSEGVMIGSIAYIDFIVGESTGIWLDITNVSNDGEDFVYVVENERVVRKNIKILAIYENKILAEGLDLNDEIIIKGLDNIRVGYKVTVVE